MSDEQEGPTPDESAGQLGWVDQETWIFRGKDPDDHISAEDFMDKQENNAALAIKNNRRLSAQVHEQEKAIVRMEEKWQKLYDTDTAALRGKVRKAAEEGDMDAYDTHSASLEERQNESPAPAGNNGIQEAAQDFVNRVPEFNEDATVQAVAKQLENEVRATESDPVRIYAEVEKRLRTELPHKFKALEAEVTPRQTVTPAGRPASKNGKLSFNSLPAEDKAAYESTKRMFKARNKDYTKDQFMKGYAEENS